MILRLEKASVIHPVHYSKPYGVLGIDWHVFDDHVEINKNVIEEGNTFSLSRIPVGEVHILLTPPELPRQKFIEFLKSPEAESIISKVADRVRVHANQRPGNETRRLF